MIVNQLRLQVQLNLNKLLKTRLRNLLNKKLSLTLSTSEKAPLSLFVKTHGLVIKTVCSLLSPYIALIVLGKSPKQPC